jgi:hypothetical protein|tara:strand:- start:3579 stop:3797 length:219 start_codon:yes stop_codon:yes gene_type:complete
MKQHIVKHKQNNKEYLLNTVELDRFFKMQDIENYTIKDKLTAQEILGNVIAFIVVAIGSVGLLMLGAIMDKL